MGLFKKKNTIAATVISPPVPLSSTYSSSEHLPPPLPTSTSTYDNICFAPRPPPPPPPPSGYTIKNPPILRHVEQKSTENIIRDTLLVHMGMLHITSGKNNGLSKQYTQNELSTKSRAELEEIILKLQSQLREEEEDDDDWD